MFKNKKILAIILIIMISVFGLSACTKAEKNATKSSETTISYPLKVVDSFKKEVTIEKEPERILSLSPSITEIIYAIGKGDKLVGRTDYCTYPEDTKKVPSVGTITDPSIEKIIELKPDVVIYSSIVKEEIIKKLESLNIKVVGYSGEESFDGTYDMINNVSKVLNAQDGASKVILSMKKKIEDVVSKVKDSKKPKVYYVIGFGKYGDFTATGDTFIGKMIEMAGGENSASDGTKWKYSIEKLVEKNPDILICPKSDGSKKGIEATNGYKDLKAVKEGKLVEIDKNIISKQGPRVADGLLELAKIIHPELF